MIEITRHRTKTIFDRLLQTTLRSIPIKNIHSPLVKSSPITASHLIESKLLQINPSYNFIPIMPSSLMKMIVTTLAQEREMKKALTEILTVDERAYNREHGLVFEEFHAMWYLAMKSHQMRNTFLKANKSCNIEDVKRAQDEFLFQNSGDAKSFLINRLFKCTMLDLFNQTHPYSNSCNENNNSELLLFSRYSIADPIIEKTLFSRNIVDKNALDLISHSQLLQLLHGQILLRNINRGAGYDYVEVNWLITDNNEITLSFDFIEMKYSNPFSKNKLTMNDVFQKHRLVSSSYQRLLNTRLRIKTSTQMRLIFCTWRPIDYNFQLENLPNNVLVYDLEKLSQAYGPSLINQGPFISKRII